MAPATVPMANVENTELRRVLAELSRYEHPLLEFAAVARDGHIEVTIDLRDRSLGLHTYRFGLSPRDLEDPRFSWHFQRQLYDCLHDYLVEMFTRNPQYKG